ncbi:hypothetical protein GCM10009696_12310 [Kocuria himachalensis]
MDGAITCENHEALCGASYITALKLKALPLPLGTRARQLTGVGAVLDGPPHRKAPVLPRRLLPGRRRWLELHGRRRVPRPWEVVGAQAWATLCAALLHGHDFAAACAPAEVAVESLEVHGMT